MPSQVIQLKHRTTGTGTPAELVLGELAYNTTGHTLVVGDNASAVQTLVGDSRQVELTGDQTITGQKTIDADNLKITGGEAGTVLTAVDPITGDVAFAPAPLPPAATDAQMDAGTQDDVFSTPLSTRSLIGASLATLTTTAKTVVPAINELQAGISLLAVGQVFVGTFQADDGSITWTSASGASGDTLPAPAAANTGWYLICDTSGAAGPGGAPAGTYESGDWLISNGAVWTHLAFGGVTTSNASTVALVPPVDGADNVQTAIELISLDKVDSAGDTMSGFLTLNAGPTAPLHAATKQYVDVINAGQDLSLSTKVNLTGDTMTGALLLSDSSPTNPLEASAKGYVDSQRDTRIAKSGDTMTGSLQLPVAMPTAATQAAHKAYIDQEISAVTAGATVKVAGPALSGNGLPSDKITFNGITTEPTTFGGLGLSSAPLTLLVVDGGTY